MAKAPKSAATLVALLEALTGASPPLARQGRAKSAIEIATCAGYPRAGLTTLVTIGNARAPFSMYRGVDVGFELTLSVPDAEVPDLLPSLAAAVRENLQRHARERRPFIESNGMYAPGYPPHFFFAASLSATPALAGRKRIGASYVHFLAAIPIDDAELRIYDRDVGALIRQLRKTRGLKLVRD